MALHIGEKIEKAEEDAIVNAATAKIKSELDYISYIAQNIVMYMNSVILQPEQFRLPKAFETNSFCKFLQYYAERTFDYNDINSNTIKEMLRPSCTFEYDREFLQSNIPPERNKILEEKYKKYGMYCNFVFGLADYNQHYLKTNKIRTYIKPKKEYLHYMSQLAKLEQINADNTAFIQIPKMYPPIFYKQMYPIVPEDKHRVDAANDFKEIYYMPNQGIYTSNPYAVILRFELVRVNPWIVEYLPKLGKIRPSFFNNFDIQLFNSVLVPDQVYFKIEPLTMDAIKQIQRKNLKLLQEVKDFELTITSKIKAFPKCETNRLTAWIMQEIVTMKNEFIMSNKLNANQGRSKRVIAGIESLNKVTTLLETAYSNGYLTGCQWQYYTIRLQRISSLAYGYLEFTKDFKQK